jgi:hypothetical protein
VTFPHRQWLEVLKQWHQPGVDGEDGHEEDEVAAAEKDLPDFGADPFLLQLLLAKNHPGGIVIKLFFLRHRCSKQFSYCLPLTRLLSLV